MTSLELFKSERSENLDDIVQPGFDWGTGKKRTKSIDLNAGRGLGTFLHTGVSGKQNYRNTDLTLSNIRINDELVPAPLHSTNISAHQIPLPFPANHPLTSHISEKAVFPTATTNVDDHPSTDTEPYIVTHKLRGNPFRREVHYQGSQQHQNPKWPDKEYMQLPRSLSDANSSSIYPAPRKLLAPNDYQSVDTSSLNVAKNVEKNLLESTYQRDYSHGEGLGTHVSYDTTSRLLPTEKLKPYFKKTFDPARPIDGMQAMHIHGNHRQVSALEEQRASTQYLPTETIKLMSENEKLDDQLRNGTDYVNLPASRFPTEQAPTWTPRSEVPKTETPRQELRFLHHLRPSTTVPQIARDHQLSHQQIEAENRLQQLELIRPQDNLNLLNQKFRTLQNARHSRPTLAQYHNDYVNTFYDQNGKYIQERSGLYHTNTYNPNALTQSMPDLANFESNQEDPETLLKDQSNLSDLLNHGEQVQNKSKPKLFQYKAIGDYQTTRNRLVNKFRVPSDSNTVDTRVQEGTKPFIQRETVYGQSYNTRKFLQENTLSAQARADPTRLMSTQYNTNLERVRSFNSYPMKALPSPTLNNNNEPKSTDDIIMGPFLPPSPYNELYATNHINEHTDGYSRRSTLRVYESPFKNEQDMLAYKYYKKQPTTTAAAVSLYPQVSPQLPTAAKHAMALPGPERVARLIEPKLEKRSVYQQSYKDVSYHESLTPIQDSRISIDQNPLLMKDNDQRFARTSDGRIKQWKLIDLQDHWSKTKAQRQHHINHSEFVPNVTESTMRAKREVMLADIIEKQRMMMVR